jgi:hypothetical protein
MPAYSQSDLILRLAGFSVALAFLAPPIATGTNGSGSVSTGRQPVNADESDGQADVDQPVERLTRCGRLNGARREGSDCPKRPARDADPRTAAETGRPR